MHKSPNRLLASLSSDAFAQIAPHLKVVELKFGDVLAEAGGPVRRVYFPFSGAISLVVELDVGTMEQTAGFLGSRLAHTQGIQRAFFYVLRIALARRRHVDNRLGDEFRERVISVHQLQINQCALISGGHRFNFLGTESSAGNQSIYSHRQSRPVPDRSTILEDVDKISNCEFRPHGRRFRPLIAGGCVRNI